jgi:hypothetical protein
MRAKRVYENISFQRGRDPLDAIGIGLQSIKDLGPLNKRPVHIFKKGDGPVQTSRGYLLWKLLNFIKQKNEAGEPVGYADCVRYYYGQWGGQTGRRTLSIGVKDSIDRYVNRVEKNKYILNGWGKKYLEDYSFFDDGRKTLREELQFQRGLDPKAALDIGAWRRGYIIDKEPDFDIDPNGYNRIDFQGEEWDFSKKVFNPDEVSQTEIDSEMAKILEPLPVVTFKYYHDTDVFPGLFGDWPDDFPFKKTPFIANCLEEEDRTFLVEPEGFNYARYSTELI